MSKDTADTQDKKLEDIERMTSGVETTLTETSEYLNDVDSWIAFFEAHQELQVNPPAITDEMEQPRQKLHDF